MFVSKTIKCKVFNPTLKKMRMLEREYENFQHYAKTNQDNGVYSLTKAVYDFKYRRKAKCFPQPMPVHRRSVKILKTNNILTPYWIRLPFKARWGGVWLPIKPSRDFDGWEVREAKLIKRENEFWVYVSVRKEVVFRESFSSILAVDLGEKVLATTVLFNGAFSELKFLGRKLRGIRRHYAWLRKRLGNRKLLKKIKRISDKEKRKATLLLHEVSKTIVDSADANNAVIFLGELKGLRKSAKGKGKRINRIISNFAFYKLTQFIEYKALTKGIPVIRINEAFSSQECSRCGELGKRINQGLFECGNCGFQANADYNGVRNIAKRSWKHVFQDGAIAFSPKPVMTNEVFERKAGSI